MNLWLTPAPLRFEAVPQTDTLILAVMRLVFYMPVPILFALLLNEIRNLRYKKLIQTVTYLPHFLSWVVIAGIFRNLLSPINGIVNYLIGLFGREPVAFLVKSEYFRQIIIISSIWAQTGWGSIVILAAIIGIEPELYDACSVDGGGRWAKLRWITFPGIMPVVLMMYILRIGRLLRSGFDQVINFYNPAVYNVGDIMNTYVFRVGLRQFDYSYATALGLFANLISFALLLLSNWGVRKIDPESSLW
ncbi:MAG: sugar ABC transporter permease [Spirochaetales bacterium]|jgi:putative aldouronate transport system permease protein|nr:sugar ABC transporter permease [Spirochaetales bacterium]